MCTVYEEGMCITFHIAPQIFQFHCYSSNDHQRYGLFYIGALICTLRYRLHAGICLCACGAPNASRQHNSSVQRFVYAVCRNRPPISAAFFVGMLPFCHSRLNSFHCTTKGIGILFELCLVTTVHATEVRIVKRTLTLYNC